MIAMIEVTAEDPLRPFDDAVRAAYKAAQDSNWAHATRVPLRDAAAAAVMAYASRPDAGDAARRYHLLLVDLAADTPPTDLALWPDETLRAVRLAATRTLANPSKPHHRPRAQALLKRLDTLANPGLQAREQVLLALSRHRQALHQLQAKPVQREASERRLAPVVVAGRMALLARLTEVVRTLPRGPLSAPGAPAFLSVMRRLQELAQTDALFDPAQQAALFELVQRALAPERADLPLAPAIAALEAIRAQTHPGVAAARFDLLAMVFELSLPDIARERLPALEGHLADVVRVATHLTDIPAASLPALLFRLRLRLLDPGNEAIEPLIDAGLATLEALEHQRAAIQADLAENQRLEDEDQRPAQAGLRQREREIEQLIAAVHGLRPAGINPSDAAGVLGILRNVEALGGGHDLDPRAFEPTVRVLAQQLERPRLVRDRVWQAASTAQGQLAQQRQALDETLRGLSFDRHVSPAKRMARQHLLQRQLEALDHARLVLGSLPLEGLTLERESMALDALARLTLALRQLVAGLDTVGLRSALEAVVASVGSARS